MSGAHRGVLAGRSSAGRAPGLDGWHTRRYRAALDGREPAEVLPPWDRAHLVRVLHLRGWTDREIADHTRMTLYTTVRIRSRLGLPPNLVAVPVADRTGAA